MRSPTPYRRSGRALIGLALLLAAGPAPVHAADPLPPATLLGTVVRTGDAGPVPYANVVETTSRRATSADERGRFELTGLPPGRRTIRIQALGGPPLVESLDLVAGATVRRTYRLTLPARDRFQQVRDSLSARGLSPPTLDPAVLAHMREAWDVRVFRLDPRHPVLDAPPDPEHRVGPWPIVAEAASPPRPVIADLLATLRASELYLPDIEGARKSCGGFAPGIGVRFNSTGVTTELLLCYACGEFSVGRTGRDRQTGDFESREPEFVRFAQRMFPDDPEIRKLGSGARRASR